MSGKSKGKRAWSNQTQRERVPGSQGAYTRPTSQQLVKTMAVYGASLAVLLFGYSWLTNSAVLSPYLALNAEGTTWLLKLFGSTVESRGSLVLSEGFSIDIVAECTSLGALAILSAGILAVPAKLKTKLFGIVLGGVVLFVINILRTTSLFYIGSNFPAALEVAHLLVWQGIMVIVAVGLWLLWLQRWVRYEKL